MKRTAIFLLSLICIALFAWMAVDESTGPDTTITAQAAYPCPVHGCAMVRTAPTIPVPYLDDSFDPAHVAECYPFGGYLGANVNWNQAETDCYVCPECVNAMLHDYPALPIEFSKSEIAIAEIRHTPLPPVMP